MKTATWTCIAVLFAVILAPTTVAVGSPILWTTESGGNGHYYELVTHDNPIAWTSARDDAAARSYLGSSGHLVTVTSAAENDFLRNTFSSFIGDPNTGVNGIYAWIGLSDATSEGNYQWVTGEAFSYSNWAPPEPNNLGNEDYVLTWIRKFSGTSVDPNGTPMWSWNDTQNFTADAAFRGAFVEYEGPFNAQVPEPASMVVWAVIGTAFSGGRWLRKRKSCR